MKKYNVKTVKGKWIKYPEDKEVQILIRPFSLFNLTKMPAEDKIDMDQFWTIFNYCILDWKGFEDNEGKKLKCDEDNKKMVFDYDPDILTFIMDEASKLRDDVLPGKEIKNLSTSQPGETKKQEK